MLVWPGSVGSTLQVVKYFTSSYSPFTEEETWSTERAGRLPSVTQPAGSRVRRQIGRLGPCPPTACLPCECVWPLGGSGQACLAHGGARVHNRVWDAGALRSDAPHLPAEQTAPDSWCPLYVTRGHVQTSRQPFWTQLARPWGQGQCVYSWLGEGGSVTQLHWTSLFSPAGDTPTLHDWGVHYNIFITLFEISKLLACSNIESNITGIK